MFSQTCLLAVLESMGLNGLRQHALTVADFYRKQRDACIAAAEKHLAGKRMLCHGPVDVLFVLLWSACGDWLYVGDASHNTSTASVRYRRRKERTLLNCI